MVFVTGRKFDGHLPWQIGVFMDLTLSLFFVSDVLVRCSLTVPILLQILSCVLSYLVLIISHVNIAGLTDTHRKRCLQKYAYRHIISIGLQEYFQKRLAFEQAVCPHQCGWASSNPFKA